MLEPAELVSTMPSPAPNAMCSMRTECALTAMRESLLRASHSSSAPLLRPTARIFDCGSYATAVAWSSRRLLRSTKAWVNSGSTRDCDPTAHHHDSAASAHSAATTSAQIPQVRMCIHPLAMADGLPAVPDYLQLGSAKCGEMVSQYG